MQKKRSDSYTIIFPTRTKGRKELDKLFQSRPNQLKKAFEKLQIDPTNYKDKSIEKLQVDFLGEYSIRISKGDRLFYDVNTTKKEVHILRGGAHDFYKKL